VLQTPFWNYSPLKRSTLKKRPDTQLFSAAFYLFRGWIKRRKTLFLLSVFRQVQSNIPMRCVLLFLYVSAQYNCCRPSDFGFEFFGYRKLTPRYQRRGNSPTSCIFDNGSYPLNFSLKTLCIVDSSEVRSGVDFVTYYSYVPPMLYALRYVGRVVIPQSTYNGRDEIE
jgi:hypothetical protein